MFKLTPHRQPSSLTTRRERDSFTDMRTLMNRLFEDLAPGRFFEEAGDAGQLAPRVEVHETPEAIEVTAELPGIDEKDVEITLERDSLSLRGEKRYEKSKEQNNCRYTERSYGSFARVIPLACEVDREKVEASFKKGVLNIRMPKSPAAKNDVRKISIRS